MADFLARLRTVRLPLVVTVPLFVLWLAAFTWFISLHAATRFIPPTLLFEVYALAAMALAFRYWPPMVRLVAGMPPPHRIAFGLLLGALVLGHFTIDNRRFFPFVAWEIFPFEREQDPVTCRELIATTSDGRRVRLLVEQLFPSIVQFDLPADPEAVGRLAEVLASQYERHHPGERLRSVDLIIAAVALHPPSTETRTQPSCALLRHYDL